MFLCLFYTIYFLTTDKIVRFLSKTPVYEVSMLTCINFLQCFRVVFSICLNSNLNFPPQQPIGYLPQNTSLIFSCEGNLRKKKTVWGGGRVMQVSIDTLYSTLDLSHIPDFILNLYVFMPFFIQLISLRRTKLYPVQQEEWKEQ